MRRQTVWYPSRADFVILGFTWICWQRKIETIPDLSLNVENIKQRVDLYGTVISYVTVHEVIKLLDLSVILFQWRLISFVLDNQPPVLRVSLFQNGQTPLMVAAEQGSLEIVQELIKRGANVNLDDIVSSQMHTHVSSLNKEHSPKHE